MKKQEMLKVLNMFNAQLYDGHIKELFSLSFAEYLGSVLKASYYDGPFGLSLDVHEKRMAKVWEELEAMPADWDYCGIEYHGTYGDTFYTMQVNASIPCLLAWAVDNNYEYTAQTFSSAFGKSVLFSVKTPAGGSIYTGDAV